MRRVGSINAERRGTNESFVTISLRTPEAAKALSSGARLLYTLTFTGVVVVSSSAAYAGMFGNSVHAYIKLTILLAVAHWLVHAVLQHWQWRSTFVSDRVTIFLTAEGVTVRQQHREPFVIQTREEIRFASRPHWLGREEERDERRVNPPVGYEYRDAWEVWCETGLDVVLVAAVSTEDDARATVRHLTEEYLFVTRGGDMDDAAPHRAEPA